MISTTTPISDDELVELFSGLETTPLALAVSGGADSMALMHMAARWAARDDVRAAWADGVRYHVTVLTVDHGLRAAAADEAAFVAREAAAVGLPCQVLRWEGEKPATGIQDAARHARRNLMLDALRAEHACLPARARQRSLVMAHHQEDQAETLIMRLARGSGLDGLCGMRAHDMVTREATSERPHSYCVALLRPLLGVPKARLVSTLQAQGARWIEDPSNEDERFERVRVRKMMPLLADLGLTAERIALSARRLRDADMALTERGPADTAERKTWLISPLLSQVRVPDTRPWQSYLLVRTLRWLTQSYGGAARPCELSQLEELALRLSNEWKLGEFAGATLGGCKFEFVGEGDHRVLRVYREGSGEGLPVIPIGPGRAVDWDGTRFEVLAGELAPTDAIVRALGMQGWADLKKAVPALADLKWPAAAAATLPVIALDGTVIAYPGIESALAHIRPLPEPFCNQWAAYAANFEPGFSACFAAAVW
jgi:tRNA(Ile)-lysidine synthase